MVELTILPLLMPSLLQIKNFILYITRLKGLQINKIYDKYNF